MNNTNPTKTRPQCHKTWEFTQVWEYSQIRKYSNVISWEHRFEQKKVSSAKNKFCGARARSFYTQPMNTKPTKTRSFYTQPMNTNPTKTRSFYTQPMNTNPTKTRSFYTRPMNTTPTKTRSFYTQPMKRSCFSNLQKNPSIKVSRHLSMAMFFTCQLVVTYPWPCSLPVS